jgi:hypothetical protein
MSTYVERALGAPPSRLYARRAMDALETLSAGLSQSHLSQEVREELALQVAELLARLERLLSMLHQADDGADGLRRRAADTARRSRSRRLGLASSGGLQ